MNKITWFASSIVLLPSLTFGQAGILDNCRSLVTDGLREYSIRTDSNEYLNSVFDRYCDSSGSTKSSSFGAGLDLVIKAIPIKFTADSQSSEQAVKNFCKNYSSVSAGRSNTTAYKERIVDRAYGSFDQCIALALTGVIVRHDVRSLDRFDFFVAPGFARPVAIRGLRASPNVSCTALAPGSTEGAAVTLTEGTRFLIGNNQTLNVGCVRASKLSGSGVQVYEEATATLFTDVAPNGNYAAFLPRDEKLPEDRASAIAKSLTDIVIAKDALQKDLFDAKNIMERRFASVRVLSDRFFVGERGDRYPGMDHYACEANRQKVGQDRCEAKLPGSKAFVNTSFEQAGDRCGYHVITVGCVVTPTK